MIKSIRPKSLPLSVYEKTLCSPKGVVEEGVIEHIISQIPIENKFCVEFGAGNGTYYSFSRYLIEKCGWNGFLIEGSPTLSKGLLKKYQSNPKVTAIESFITRENIVELFEKAKVPKNLGFLCIDMDGNDYHIWKALKSYRPSIVCIEYNPSYKPDQDFVIDYDPEFWWQNDDYYGASFKSMVELGKEMEMELVHCSNGGDNLIFIRSDLAHVFKLPNNPSEFYQLPQYGRNGRARNGKGHPASKRNTSGGKRALYKLRYLLMSPLRRMAIKKVYPD